MGCKGVRPVHDAREFEDQDDIGAHDPGAIKYHQAHNPRPCPSFQQLFFSFLDEVSILGRGEPLAALTQPHISFFPAEYLPVF